MVPADGTPDPGLERIKSRLASALGATDQTRARALIEELIDEIAPLHGELLFALAGLHARQGETERAYLWLEYAADAGFWDLERLIQDPSFAALRDNERFQSIRRRIWAHGYIAMLERDERDDFQKPDQVIAALEFRAGERVAEIGAGSGYFTFRVARAVGPSGTVIALDATPEMLDYLARRKMSEGAGNVILRRVSREDPELAAESVDTVLLIDTLHYIQDRRAYAGRVRTALRPGGRLALIDYRPKPWAERPWGPPPEQQIPRDVIDREFAAAGFALRQSFEFLPEQYFAVYGRA
jgi:SAM-dependent methyltransferase